MSSTARALSVVVCVAAAACAGPQAPAVTAPVRGCDLAGRVWQQTSPGPCAFSTWRFERRQDGTYSAAETGCSGATGIARWNGTVVTLDFYYPGGAGQYLWPLDAECRSRPGEVNYGNGPAVNQSAASTLTAVSF